MSYRNYTNSDFVLAVQTSFSIAEVIRKLGLIPAGGNYSTVKYKIEDFDLDVSHFTGQKWSKGKHLKHISGYSRTHIKKPLISQRGHCCQECKLTVWRDSLIPLEIHHIDGDRTNNSDSNLLLLCPNCHSLTDNFRRKKPSVAQLVGGK